MVKIKDRNIIQERGPDELSIHMRQISIAKWKHLGFWENLYLQWLGKRDGKRGLPRQNEENIWISPQLSKTIHSYKETEAAVWRETEITLFDLFVEAEKKRQEAEKMDNLLATLSEDSKADDVETQEKTIRINASLAGVQARVAELHAYIKEAECTSRLICKAILENYRQKLDAYWGGAWKKNPKIPPAPPQQLFYFDQGNAETLFLKQHHNSEYRTERVLELEKEEKI